MHVKIENGLVSKYPYSITELKKDHKQTSFPKEIDDALLAEFGVFPVVRTERPQVDHTKITTEAHPVKMGEEWVQQWTISDASEELVAERTHEKAVSVRTERDAFLNATDWVVTKSFEAGESVPSEWQAYRQALRDVPSQAGFPFNVTWPVKPF